MTIWLRTIKYYHSRSFSNISMTHCVFATSRPNLKIKKAIAMYTESILLFIKILLVDPYSLIFGKNWMMRPPRSYTYYVKCSPPHKQRQPCMSTPQQQTTFFGNEGDCASQCHSFYVTLLFKHWLNRITLFTYVLWIIQ